MRWVVFILIYLTVKKKKSENAGATLIRHDSAAWRLIVFYLMSIVRHGRGKLSEKKGNSDDFSRSFFKGKTVFFIKKRFL